MTQLVPETNAKSRVSFCLTSFETADCDVMIDGLSKSIPRLRFCGRLVGRAGATQLKYSASVEKSPSSTVSPCALSYDRSSSETVIGIFLTNIVSTIITYNHMFTDDKQLFAYVQCPCFIGFNR